MYGIMRQRSSLYFIAGFFSLILSIWAAAKTSVINPDAICYLYSAEAMSRGLSVASHLCTQSKWPFYSVLIFGVSHITTLSVIASAYLLNSLFSLISVIAFIAIVNTLTQHSRIVWLSALVILLAHEFNGLRVDIIRDHGFWAFYLLSIFFMLQYVNFPKWSHALCWSASIIVATLFRIEGAVFLLLLPFVVFADARLTLIKRFTAFLQLNTLTLMGGVALFLWVMLHPQQELGRLTEIQFQFIHGLNEFIQAFQQTANALKMHVLSPFSTVDATWIAVGLFAIWYLFSVITNVSVIYAVLIMYVIFQSRISTFTQENRLVLVSYILINILITLFFLVDNLFLSGRYLIAISLVLMLWVPFALEDLILQWHTRKWPLMLAGLLIIIYGLSGVFSLGHSKKYIREGGDWLALHASANEKIYSNDYQLLYYSNHFGDSIFKIGPVFQNINQIANGKWKQYDYLALRISRGELVNNKSIAHEINLIPIIIFQNDRGDQVRIYQTHSHKKMEN